MINTLGQVVCVCVFMCATLLLTVSRYLNQQIKPGLDRGTQINNMYDKVIQSIALVSGPLLTLSFPGRPSFSQTQWNWAVRWHWGRNQILLKPPEHLSLSPHSQLHAYRHILYTFFWNIWIHLRLNSSWHLSRGGKMVWTFSNYVSLFQYIHLNNFCLKF